MHTRIIMRTDGTARERNVIDAVALTDRLPTIDLVDALHRAGLGQVLDVVPNHMAITPENAWWADVLENGPSSRFAWYFDVDWDPPEPRLRNTVLLPAGWDVTRVSQSGTLGTFEDRAFVALINLNAENNYKVTIRARKR